MKLWPSWARNKPDTRTHGQSCQTTPAESTFSLRHNIAMSSLCRSPQLVQARSNKIVPSLKIHCVRSESRSNWMHRAFSTIGWISTSRYIRPRFGIHFLKCSKFPRWNSPCTQACTSPQIEPSFTSGIWSLGKGHILVTIELELPGFPPAKASTPRRISITSRIVPFLKTASWTSFMLA